MSIKDNNADKTDSAKETPWDEGLRGRERIFILHYCTDEECLFNGRKAYKKAYTRIKSGSTASESPADETCDVNASKLLRKTKVKDAIRKLLRLSQDESDEENAYRILKQCELLAFFNPADIMNIDGTIKVNDLSELGPYSRCVRQITPVFSKGGIQVGSKVTLADPKDYIQMLAKYLNLVRPDNNTGAIVPVIVMPGKTPVEQWQDTPNQSAVPVPQNAEDLNDND